MSCGKIAVLVLICVSVLFGLHCGDADACTGLRLIAEDGAHGLWPDDGMGKL